MNAAIQNLVQWCMEERERLLAQRDHRREGYFKFGESRGGDRTSAADGRPGWAMRKIAELDQILQELDEERLDALRSD